jgi:thiol-disulfide isomerase/thioredoxin
VKLDPGFAPAWSALAFIVAGQGKLAESREHARTAAAAWPNSALYGMLAVRAMQSAGFAPALRAAENYANAFPDQAASILEYVARTAPTPEDARAVYELLRQRHLPAAAGALEPLFHIYLREDPAKALTLARQIAKPALAVYAQAIINANTALAAGSPAEALSTLDALNLPPLADRRTLELTRAKAREATGDIAPAYAQLLAYFATAPSDETRAALLTLGRRLDKDPVQVEDEVFAQRAKSARPGIAFSAAPFTQGPPFSLAGLKDKVFLLNFWYPLCGPCRGEFQFLQDVLEKYRDRGFAIIAVNAHPTEDSWVLPLFRGWGLGFLPAHGSESILKTYNVTAFPSSFLYGPDGRIYYTPGPVGNAEARRELELHVEALLNHRFPE